MFIKVVIHCALFDFTYLIFFLQSNWYIILKESDEDDIETETSIIFSNKDAIFEYFQENIQDRDYVFDVIECTIDIIGPNQYKIWSTFWEDDIHDIPPFTEWYFDKIKKYINFYKNLKTDENELKKLLITHTYNKMTLILPTEIIKTICKYI
jgi:hypothetical protein